MSVKSWGKGKPDYYKSTIASRPVMLVPETRTEDDETVTQEVLQERMLIDKTYTISAGASIVDLLYTVPSDKKLSFGGGYVSCENSCINRLRIVAPTTELIGDFRYDMQGDLGMTSLTGQELPAGTTITAYVYNNDADESDFSLVLSGVLTKT